MTPPPVLIGWLGLGPGVSESQGLEGGCTRRPVSRSESARLSVPQAGTEPAGASLRHWDSDPRSHQRFPQLVQFAKQFQVIDERKQPKRHWHTAHWQLPAPLEVDAKPGSFKLELLNAGDST